MELNKVTFETLGYLFVQSVPLHPLLSLRSSENDNISQCKEEV